MKSTFQRLRRWFGGAATVTLAVSLAAGVAAETGDESNPSKYPPLTVPELTLVHPDELFAEISGRIQDGTASTQERRGWYEMRKRYYPYIAAALPPVDWYKRSAAARAQLPEAHSCSWSHLGPLDFDQGGSTVTGRGTALWVNPANKNQIIAGFADGGVWKTMNQGNAWTSIFDFADSIAVGAVTAIVPQGGSLDSATIWVATGEGNFNGDGVQGVGVYRSDDGGATWVHQPVPFITDQAPSRTSIRRIEVDPRDVNKLWIAADTGLFRTIDGGANWTLVTQVPYYEKFPGDCWYVYWTDLIIDDSTNPSTIYLGGPRPFDSGCSANARQDNGIFRSSDDGATWQNIAKTAASCPAGRGYTCVGTGFANSPGNIGRLTLINSVSDKRHLYALVHNVGTNQSLGIWETTNAQAATVTWTARSTTNYCNAQCWYDMTGAVHPTNPSRLVVGGLNAYISNNNGGTLTQVSSWFSQGSNNFAHADHHHMKWADATTVYDLGDGGLYIGTVNAAATNVTWVERNSGGIDTTQFYGFANHPTDPYQIHGGLQDNGEVRTISSGSAITGWTDAAGGDGGFSLTNQSSPNIQYEEYVYAIVSRSTNTGVTYGGCFRRFGGCNNCNGGCVPDNATEFIAPLQLDANNQGILYSGSNRVYRNNPAGSNTWFTYSPDLSAGAAGESIVNIHSAANNGTLGTMYAGTSNGQVWVTTNATADTQPTWTNRTAAPLPAAAVTWVTADPVNGQRAVVVFSGWGHGHVFRTLNGGASWTDISGGLPDEPFASAVIDPSDVNQGYVGSDYGVYVNESIWTSTTWARTNAGQLPHVRANQLEFSPANGNLRVATHGRGIWECVGAVCGNGTQEPGEECDDGASNSNTGPCNLSCALTTCGDGTVQAPNGVGDQEQCDDGPQNSDTVPDACRLNCLPASCGDGVVDPGVGDICDDGPLNSDTTPDACRSTCRPASCGDGVVDPGIGDTCDDGPQNSDTTPDACRRTCQPASCGDGVIDPGVGDLCDDGPQNSDTTPDACRSTCRPASCGDGVVDPGVGDVCDDGPQNSDSTPDACRLSCQPASCGDGVIDPGIGDVCDDGPQNSDTTPDACRTNCEPASCGDGVIDPGNGEECDDGNTTPGDGCDGLCLEECATSALSSVTPLFGVHHLVNRSDATFSWESDPSAPGYHLNSVDAPGDLVDAHRAPGFGVFVCDTTSPTLSCDVFGAITDAREIIFYQAFAACGANGSDEGP